MPVLDNIVYEPLHDSNGIYIYSFRLLNGKKLGHAYVDVAGEWVFVFTVFNNGIWSGYGLRNIANVLDLLNGRTQINVEFRPLTPDESGDNQEYEF